MKHIYNFESYHINEGWKENVLVGILSLFGSYAMGQKSDNIQTKKAFNKSSMESLLKQGWSLDSTSIDTIYLNMVKKAPDSDLVAIRLMLDKDQYFQSGKFTLNETMKSSIDSTLEEIVSDGGILMKVEIESSTDKQGLSQNLQNELKKLGYTPDNKGLSKARSESVSDYLEESGVNDSIIIQNQLWEMGSQEIEQGARYVAVDFYYVIVPEEVQPSISDDYKLKRTYYLSREKEPTKIIKLKKPKKHRFARWFKKILGKIKNHDIKTVRCAKW
jgi:outer membrane protein OmpA-like peptidoglycan-associated protein